MIRTLICVKSIPDLDQVVAADWKFGSNLSEPDVSYVNSIMNYYDENAMELLLRLKDACASLQEETTMDVITIGSMKCAKILKDSYAAGADKCIHVLHTLDFKDNYHAIARILAAYIKTQAQYDVIMCGESAAPYENGQTAYELSCFLDMPCIPDIKELLPEKKGYKVIYKRSEAVQEVLVKVPFLGIAGNISGMKLRLPTLKERLLSTKKEVIQMTVSELGLDENALCENKGKELVCLSAEDTMKECCYLDFQKFPEHVNRLAEMIKDGC